MEFFLILLMEDQFKIPLCNQCHRYHPKIEDKARHDGDYALKYHKIKLRDEWHSQSILAKMEDMYKITRTIIRSEKKQLEFVFKAPPSESIVPVPELRFEPHFYRLNPLYPNPFPSFIAVKQMLPQSPDVIGAVNVMRNKAILCEQRWMQNHLATLKEDHEKSEIESKVDDQDCNLTRLEADGEQRRIAATINRSLASAKSCPQRVFGV